VIVISVHSESHHKISIVFTFIVYSQSDNSEVVQLLTFVNHVISSHHEGIICTSYHDTPLHQLADTPLQERVNVLSFVLLPFAGLNHTGAFKTPVFILFTATSHTHVFQTKSLITTLPLQFAKTFHVAFVPEIHRLIFHHTAEFISSSACNVIATLPLTQASGCFDTVQLGHFVSIPSQEITISFVHHSSSFT
jgi:hypothetical protein